MESKYKVGDKVRVKSLEWYNSNKDGEGHIDRGTILLLKEMSAYCGKEFEVRYVNPGGEYFLKGNEWIWEDWMFEDNTDINTNKQQILEQIERVQQELDKLRL